MNTFNDYAQLYLVNSKYKHAHSSYMSNRSKVNNLLKAFGDRYIVEIKHSEINSWNFEISEKLSNKTINDHFSILRKIFRTAINDGVISLNPMTDIVTLPTYKSAPNPFLKNELIALKNTNTESMSEKNLLFFGVLTGLRMCESLALTWDCVDLNRGEIQINKAVVLGNYKLPKTIESFRTVELNAHAINILKNQFEITGHLKNRVIKVLQEDNRTKVKQSVQNVFVSSISNKPMSDVKEFFTTIFKDFLRQAGVKKRGPNQVRHTFASQSLIAGINMEWIRRQMGHTTTQMIEEHYGEWLIVDAPDYSQNLGKALDCVFDSNVVHGNFSKSSTSSVASSWMDNTECKTTPQSNSSCKTGKRKMSRCA